MKKESLLKWLLFIIVCCINHFTLSTATESTATESLSTTTVESATLSFADAEPAPKPQEANITLVIIAITKRIFFIIFNLFSLYKRGEISPPLVIIYVIFYLKIIFYFERRT